MIVRSALAFTAIALTPTSLANATPLIVDQQRVDQHPAARPAQPDVLRGLTDENGVSPLFVEPAEPRAPAINTNLAPLSAVSITGSSLPTATLEATWRNRVGASLDEATITAISDALTAAYQQSDIALYSIVTPAQDLSDGALDVRVVEGHVANIVIQTDDADAPDIRLARTYAERLTTETPLRRSTLERMMSLIRDIPGERVEATMAPAAEAGGTQLTLALRRNRADVGFNVSTRGTPLLGRTQAGADVALNGMIRGGDQTNIAVTLPLGQDSFRYAALSYTAPAGESGASITANISNMHTEPEGLNQEGEATAGGVSFSYPIIRGFTQSVYVSAGLDALDTENATVGQVVDTSRVRAFRIGLSYADGSATTSRNASAFASFGIDGLGARVDPLLADADFAKLALAAGWSHLYAERITLRLNAQAQLSDSALPTSEQMALGGDAYGRGFASAITQGDEGFAGSIETAFILPSAWLPTLFNGAETYAFVDGGYVSVNARPIFAGFDDSLASAGFGARIPMGRELLLGLELARPIETPNAGDDSDWRFVYSLVGRR